LEIFPPEGAPAFEKLTSKYFPNREELLFLRVLAFPKDSNKGLERKMILLISSTRLENWDPPFPEMAAM
jgi:hypothetical protein